MIDVPTGAAVSESDLAQRLEDALRAWWEKEISDWDALVDGDSPETQGVNGSDLWDSMPEVDSKAVARTAPIFEDFLGVPLDVTLIESGGYSSIGEMIDDLVPKMMERRKS